MEASKPQSPLALFLSQERDLAPHLRSALERLSPEHPSGIARSQQDTPMMKQFIAAKDEVVDALVFFRMGDFFELFGTDAVIAADICGLTLTSRDKNSDNPVPMAGVPVVNYRASIKKCVAAGFKVAVVDQVEDPRTAKGIVRREIVRIATPAVPGDLSDDDGNEAQGCYLAAACETSEGWTLAYVDVSTGEFRITGRLEQDLLEQELATIVPREILVKNDGVTEMRQRLKRLFQRQPAVSAFEAWVLRSPRDALVLLHDFFGSHAENRFGISHLPAGVECVAGVLAYLKGTQRDVIRNLRTVVPYELSRHLLIDDATRRHLDFFSTAHGERKGSLYWLLNRCATPGGSRLLARRLNYPFKDPEEIRREHESVEELVRNAVLVEELGLRFRALADVERLLARAAQGSIDPRGMAWLRLTLCEIPTIREALAQCGLAASSLCTLSAALAESEAALDSLTTLLRQAIADEPVAILGKNGRVFREGYHAELDELTALETNFDTMISNLERREREASQISTLKIGYTKVFGYYFEISKGKLSQAPAHFIRKQTLTNGERYTTPELKELEERALTATERRATLERDLFESLRQQILGYAESLTCFAAHVAHLDLLRNYAGIASTYGWCKPRVVDEPLTALEQSTHPVLREFQASHEPFVSNDIVVGKTSQKHLVESELLRQSLARHPADATILLITGPNMAGKSTIMRQIGLAQVLCQMGSFVPAVSATLGVCDRIFTRIGSADFALRNQSTFMLEMLESANMLRLATPRSLLLMDELGRGTSTYDGLSLAWAILEDLHDRIGARTLFSTHYHELLEVTETRAGIMPMQMEVIERERTHDLGAGNREILFSRRFVPGAAGKSYGLHVAELAGLSAAVVSRASEILEGLAEKHKKQQQFSSKSPTLQADIVAPPQPMSPPDPRRSRRLRTADIPEGASIFDFVPYANDDSSQDKS